MMRDAVGEGLWLGVQALAGEVDNGLQSGGINYTSRGQRAALS